MQCNLTSNTFLIMNDKNIKLIIHIADIHIRNVMRHEEYAEQLTKFIDKCKEIIEPYDREEIRFVICGDLVHQKNTISNELITFTTVFIRQLEELANVIVIAGNHDLIVNNMSRKDTISCIFETAAFTNAFFLDMELEYNSGYIVDNNIIWAIYSIYDNYKRPNIEEIREKYGNDKKIIGLFHGMIVGSHMSDGNITDSGIDGDIFEGCDFVIAGDIHKRQTLKRKGVDIVYSGSLIQQNYGETITQHGFALWDLENNKHEFIDLKSEYGLYDFEIKNINDIDNDSEKLLNY